MAKTIEEIIKEFEKQCEETKDDISDLLDEAADSGDDTKKFTEVGRDLMNYTANHINEAAPWLMASAVALPSWLKWLNPYFTIGAVAGSILAAPFDYASDHINLGSQVVPEYLQDIYDYAADYNEKLQADKENFKYADKYENDAWDQWEDIKKFVDNNGKLENPASRDDFKKAIDKMKEMVPDVNLTVVGDQIQDYTYLDKTMYNHIKKESIKQRREYLEDRQNEAEYYLDSIDEMYQNALDKRNHSHGDYQKKVTQRDMAIAYMYGDTLYGNTTFRPSEEFTDLLNEEEAAKEKFKKADMEYGAISELHNSYETVNEINKNLSTQESELDKAIAQAEYEVNYPDAGKPLAQLEGEAYAKSEIERHKVSPPKNNVTDNVFSKIANIPNVAKGWISKAAEVWKGIVNASGADYDETIPPSPASVTISMPYNIDQPPVNDTSNQVYNPEIAETVNSLNDAVIIQAAALPEAMREIGQQSIAAFTEGLLAGDDEQLGERIAEATLKIANMFSDNIGDSFYQSGGESAIRFMEGFEDELDRIMAERSLAVEGMTAGQQMAMFNYYQSAPQQSSTRNDKIVIENKADLNVMLDRDVLGRSVYEWTKEYNRKTGR